MIDVFSYILIGASVLVGLLAVVLGLAGRKPSDLTVLGLVLVEVLVVAQVVIAIVAPMTGNHPTGNLLEFWMYLGTAVVIPVAAIFWALTDRSRWSTVVLGVAALAIAVMSFRMLQIWFVQVA